MQILKFASEHPSLRVKPGRGEAKPPQQYRVGERLRFFVFCACLLILNSVVFAQISVDGHYWAYNGQRILLLGGWNHGHNPFIDHDTDNDKDNQGVSSVEQIQQAMDELAAAGGNYLRCVLDPGMAAGVQGFDFCALAGKSHDLSNMAGPFWERLEMFIEEADKRDMIVQIEVWDRFDLIDGSWGGWPVSPWNPKNNKNYTAKTSGLRLSYKSYKTHPFLQGVPGHPVYENAPAPRKQQFDLVRRYQDRFVAKLLSITLNYNNVLYCMNNETHEHAAWGQYWMRFIETQAREQGKSVATTDMFDDIYNAESSRGVKIFRQQRTRYDYADISQANSRHRDQEHWDAVLWLSRTLRKVDPPYLLHMTKLYGNDLALNGKPWSRWKPGDTNNAIEEWWRNLLAGVAGVRFHRPTAGIGLCKASKNCIRAARKVETKVKFWDVEPRLDLLAAREADEAYLAAKPGHAYILYFTQDGGGAVKLALRDSPDTTFQLYWLNVDAAEWEGTATIAGGRAVPIQRPSDAAHWVAVIVRKEP
ncbi:hypothetical protein GF373_11220 [bacterium]|nr:hypothetical protein [bacterium]